MLECPRPPSANSIASVFVLVVVVVVVIVIVVVVVVATSTRLCTAWMALNWNCVREDLIWDSQFVDEPLTRHNCQSHSSV